jgi:ABC-type polysaccharide transport system permease subunit
VTIDFMVLPGMLYFIINNYIPMFGITIAFKKVDYSVGVWKSPWVGLSNFKMLFAHNGSFFQSDAFLITRNTLLYNATFIILGILMGVIVGICLADIFSRALQKFFQTSILLPQLISMVIVAYIVYALLSNETGMVNHLLGEGNEINFYQKSVYWPFILVFIYVWKQVGYNSIIFLSSIVSIDHSIYEAAKVDGASKWQQIRFVTLPMLKPTVITLMLLQVGRIFYSDFGLFYQVPLDSGALYNVTNTVDTYVYRCLMVLNNVSVASAGSTYQAIVGFVLVFTVNMLVRRYDRENALF